MVKICRKRSGGKIELIVGMYLLVFLVLIFTMQEQMYLFTISGSMMEDAIAASNLASAVIDVREYGMSHILQIESPDAAYELYREALKQNLGLGDDWRHRNQDLISSPIQVQQYIIYNVRKKDVEVYSFDKDGNCSSWIEYEGLGRVYTPEGIQVQSTSVYSRVGFEVKGFLGVSVYAEKEKTVDIISSLMGEEML